MALARSGGSSIRKIESDPASLEELQQMLGFNIGETYEYDTSDYEK
jgi:hypothetical protein